MLENAAVHRFLMQTGSQKPLLNYTVVNKTLQTDKFWVTFGDTFYSPE